MAITTIITDGSGVNGSATVLRHPDIDPGLVVYTEPYRQVVAQTKAAVNTTYGADLNKDGRFTGTPDIVHNGTDTVVWTGSNLVGANFVFNSTTFAQAGTKSISGAATVNNDEALLTRGSTLTAASYSAFTGYIYLTSWTTASNVQILIRNGGTVVSTTVNLSTYISGTTLNTWQRFVIPLSAFALTALVFDQIVIRTIGTGSNTPDYYLDTLQMEESNGGLTYSVLPDDGTIYTVTDLSITMADAFDSTLANATVPKLLYNQLLAVSALTTGVQFKLTTNDIVRFNSFFKQHLDFMTFPGIQVSSGGDATNMWVNYQVHFSTPFVLDARLKDKFEIILTEDLSGLLYFKVLVRGHKEEII